MGYCLSLLKDKQHDTSQILTKKYDDARKLAVGISCKIRTCRGNDDKKHKTNS